jgi:hypothetical protein
MKIAITNFSGNVGKTTIARYMLAPRLNNAPLISVESINGDGAEATVVRARQFGQLMESLAALDDVVVDVGSSNAEDFVQRMRNYRGSHEDFDLYVVPTVPALKQQHDTVTTIGALAEMGVRASRIRVLFNMLEPADSVTTTFAAILKYHAAKKTFTLRENAMLHANELFGKINGAGPSISAILKDPTDLKARLKSARDDDERLRIGRQIGIKRLAISVAEELDAAFKALVK